MAKVVGPGGQAMSELKRAERDAWERYRANPNSRTKRTYEDASRLLRAATIRASR